MKTDRHRQTCCAAAAADPLPLIARTHTHQQSHHISIQLSSCRPVALSEWGLGTGEVGSVTSRVQRSYEFAASPPPKQARPS